MNKITAADLPSLLDNWTGIELLSIDCFDTLIWRRFSAPKDVFQNAANTGLWEDRRITASLRVLGEHEARRARLSLEGSAEVTLREIYQALNPEFQKFQVDDLVAGEVFCEKSLCFVHHPIADLIRAAIERGIKVSVTSDTYFTPDELREIMQAAGFADTRVAINCSSEWGVSKSNGLVKLVAAGMNVSPAKVLHLGDNPHADVEGPQRDGIAALLYDPIPRVLRDRDRASENCLLNLSPNTRDGKTPVWNTCKIAHARCTYPLDTAEAVVGYGTVGPLVAAFARSIQELLVPGRQEMQIAFLMRDGYLPRLAFEALSTHAAVASLEISRFAAIAASFYGPPDVELFLSKMPVNAHFAAASRQLGFAETISAELDEFRSIARSRMDEVLSYSAAYRARLSLYLKSTLAPDKRVLLVDLGYEGTVERRLRPLFEELGWELQSHYLLATPVTGNNRARGAVIGYAHDDERLSNMLMSYIAPLELWCSSGEGSVVDYTGAGEPVRSPDNVLPEQRASARKVQEAALAFVRDWADVEVTPAEVRQIAIGRLGAIQYWQGPEEIDLLRRMRLDVNLGTDLSLPIVDLERAGQQLRRRGLFYFDARQERSMCFGAELRVFGIELSTTLAQFKRFGMTLSHKDLSMRSSIAKVRFSSAVAKWAPVPAYATHDGFYAIDLPCPVGDSGDYVNSSGRVYLGLGEYTYVQIEAVLLIPIDTLGSADEMSATKPMRCELHNAEMIDRGLVRTENRYAEISAACVPDHITRFVFRPISPR